MLLQHKPIFANCCHLALRIMSCFLNSMLGWVWQWLYLCVPFIYSPNICNFHHCSCCCSVSQSRQTFCKPMNCSTPGLPVPHHLSKFDQVHLHCIGDAIHSSHPLMPSYPSAFNLSQHQDFSNELSVCIRWPNTGVSASLTILTSIQCWFPLRLTNWSSYCPRDSHSTTIWRHQFFSAPPSLQSSSHNHMWPLGRP